jgi:hypothetical protein
MAGVSISELPIYTGNDLANAIVVASVLVNGDYGDFKVLVSQIAALAGGEGGGIATALNRGYYA